MTQPNQWSTDDESLTLTLKAASHEKMSLCMKDDDGSRIVLALDSAGVDEVIDLLKKAKTEMHNMETTKVVPDAYKGDPDEEEEEEEEDEEGEEEDEDDDEEEDDVEDDEEGDGDDES